MSHLERNAFSVPQIDPHYVTELLARLVTIDSVNPTLVDGGAGEAEIAHFVARELRGFGMDVTLLETEHGRVNVVGIRKGRGGGRSLMLYGHLDTVGVVGMYRPLTPVIETTRMYGRGTYDMKGGLAACVGVAKALHDHDIELAGDVILVGVCDEEHSSIGMQHVLREFSADGAIVTEPTEMEICVAHKGFIWYDVAMAGRAAHGSRYDLGIDANLAMGRFLGRLDGHISELERRTPHPFLGSPSMHVGTLCGGTGISTYSDHCVARIERRTLPGETESMVTGEIESLLQSAQRGGRDATTELTATVVRPAFEVSSDAEIVQSIRAAATSVLGAEPPTAGQNPWMDASLMAEAGIETVVMGVAGAGAHALIEWVDLDTVHDLSQIICATAIDYCSRPKS